MRQCVQKGSKLPAGVYTCDQWCDLLHLEGDNALATYGDDFYAGRPAITENRFGKGRAIYVATRPEPALVSALIGTLLGDLSITAPLEAPESVEVTRREGDGRAYTFVLNHNLFSVPVSLRRRCATSSQGKRMRTQSCYQHERWPF